MRMTKLIKSVALGAAALGIFVLAGCGSSPQETGEPHYKIGIVQLVEHSALDDASRGFVDGLKARGFEEGKNVAIDRQNAQADQSNLQNIVQRFISDKVNLICAIATPSVQSAANATKEIPIVGTAVTDYVSAKVVQSSEMPGGNVTGTSDMSPISDQIDLLLKLYPNAKTIGTIYSSSEVNSEIQVKEMTEYAAAKGLTVRTATISTVNDIPQAAQSLVSDVDVFYEPSDNVIASAMPTLVSVTDPAGKGVICAASTMVAAGGLATYGIDYYKLGVQTGEMAADILEGKRKPSEMKIETARDLMVVINKKNAAKLGLTIPDEVLQGATIVD
nr:ABC transporter substrate-binding protein [uncultured Selenomonas sp.]